MTDDERLTAAVNVFATVFTREKHLSGDDRLKEAYRAARRTEGTQRPENAGVRAAIEMREREPIVPNDIREGRASQIIAAISLKHDTTSVDVRGSSRCAGAVAAREEAAYELARAGLGHRAVARLLGRASQSIVRTWIEHHEARISVVEAEAKEVAHG